MPIFQQAKSSNARRSLRRGLSLLFLLSLAVFWSGCKESPLWVKEGALFVAPEKAPPGKALVYIYWPREEQGKRNHLWVGPCENLTHEILPSGYTSIFVEPGPNCFKVEAQSDLLNANTMGASVTQDLGSVELNAEPGRTFFIRLERERGSLIARAPLRLIEPGVAGPEISRCRRSIPLTGDELYQRLLEQSGT